VKAGSRTQVTEPAPGHRGDGTQGAPLTWLDAFRDLFVGAADAAALPLGYFALSRVPRGDGHAVLVLPGFLSPDQPTWPLRWYLAQIGYVVHPWGLGYNMGFSTEYHYDIEALVEHRLKEVFIDAGDRKISLIGWSLGGVYAKFLARRHPTLIRDVITLGSPISGDTSEVSVWRVYQWVSKMDFADPEFRRKLRELNRPLEGVPITAIYCKKDGVVPWRNAREKPGPLVQNIEVAATHVGMGFDAFVLYLIAHRLAKSAARSWRPLDVPALARRFARERLPF
jgi:pimeloyl-ACP methyl ester carboxylesterase